MPELTLLSGGQVWVENPAEYEYTAAAPDMQVQVDVPAWEFVADTADTVVDVEVPAWEFDANVPVTEVDTYLIPGPRGPVGPTGPPGSSFTHVQSTPAATWTIAHNLNRVGFPVIVLDGAFGEQVFTDVEVLDLNTIVLTFPEPVSGYAYL